jgi:hypothetical protein
VTEYRQILERRKGQRDQVLHELEQSEQNLKLLNRQALYCEEAQLIIQTVAELTQNQLVFHIKELVTLALASVFQDPYQFGIEFVLRRGRTECDLFFIRNEKSVDPLSASGGGAVDVAAFALQIALWSLGRPRFRNVLILDEPLRFLKGNDLPEKGALMIKEISEKLGIQVIIVSHIPDQIEGSDKVFELKLVKDRSILI